MFHKDLKCFIMIAEQDLRDQYIKFMIGFSFFILKSKVSNFLIIAICYAYVKPVVKLLQ